MKSWWWRFKHSIKGDLCESCGEGLLIEVGTSGCAVLVLHLRCNHCGRESQIIHSPGM